MMAEIKYWKRFAAWVTGLKDKPLKSANWRLTALYVLLTFLILSVFLAVLNYYRDGYLYEDLHGKFISQQVESSAIAQLSSDLETTSLFLSAFLLAAIAVLSYFAVQMTLKPIKIFLEGHRRFIADASHELRTPLTTMRTEIEVALLDPEATTKTEAIDILKSNMDEIDRMSKILTNLLDLASFNDVSGNPPMVSVDLEEVLERIIERTRNLAVQKNIHVLTHNVQPIIVSGNATALEEIVFNILKNAIHYSNSGGNVEVSLRPFNSRYGELIIKDHGIGIAPQELPHIFEPFYRSERSLHMHTSGAGLGLPIVREMVKRHHGSIQVESAQGKGTAITVRLPLAEKKPQKLEDIAEEAE